MEKITAQEDSKVDTFEEKWRHFIEPQELLHILNGAPG